MIHRDTILTEIDAHTQRLDAAGDPRWVGLTVAHTILDSTVDSDATHEALHEALTRFDECIGDNVANDAIRGGLLLAHRIVLGYAEDFAPDVLAHA